MRAPHKGTEAFVHYALTYEGNKCLIWPYALDTGGYGQAYIDGKRVAAHRALCIMAHGEPPFEGAQAAHYRCGDTRCMNKRHIRWSTIELNHDDKRRHGTMTRGEIHPKAKLTEAEVLSIIEDRRGLTELAHVYGCTKQSIRAIKLGINWSWLTGIKRAA